MAYVVGIDPYSSFKSLRVAWRIRLSVPTFWTLCEAES